MRLHRCLRLSATATAIFSLCGARAASALRSALPRTIYPCHNATGLYSGVQVIQTGTSLSLVPAAGSPYARYGRGTGNVTSGGQRAEVVFAATGSSAWGGQWVGGCAGLFLSLKHEYVQLLRDDPGPRNWTRPATAAPAWVKDLVIYEIAPRGFTSPAGAGADGMGTGTFASLAERAPYLASLGVTAVWLAGYCDANAHFFSIWSVYATERPDSIDPALGTAADLKALVARMHGAGIKVFLDVVTHGVTFSAGVPGNRSQSHPNPFLAANPDYFFHQSYNPPGTPSGKWLMADYNYGSATFQQWWTSVWVNYVKEFDVDGFRLDGPNGIAFSSEVMAAWDTITAATAAAGKPITVFGEMERYHFSEHDVQPTSTDLAKGFSPPQDPAACFQSTMLSCHDGGFDQGPGNYYGVRGSRAKLGYQAVLSWRIPVLFSGDEANLDPVSLPALRKGCYSGGGGPGGWLYGSQIQWSQISADPAKAAMLRDASRMLAIRRNESDVIHADQCTSHVLRVPASASWGSADNDGGAGAAPATLWVPYARFLPGKKVVVIAANPSNVTDAHLTVNVSVAAMGFDVAAVEASGGFSVLDLWSVPAPPPRSATAAQLEAWPVTVPRDGQPGGGLAVLKVLPAAQPPAL